ncbi:MAG: type IV pilin-like G/H family protein [Iphinoe sp. HA4291-MV1]|jgi:prepilin-type N-terminal cleavage/methylation domain-containing protein|nr:type IV pilin-like G/H family protein [Iphinoe sp. HA4291-MV1]
MKTKIKAQFLQYILNKKKQDEGFTLIELLVVIIIIGILSAIALPSFLNQANKAKQSEAKQYISAMNRAQQAYYLENSAFAGQNEFEKLGIGIKTATENYNYEIKKNANQAVNNGISRKEALKSYAGVVILKQDGTSEATTQAILCESNNIGAVAAREPNTDEKAQPKCPNGFSELNQSPQPSNSTTPNQSQ